jgi:hypothetical protein
MSKKLKKNVFQVLEEKQTIESETHALQVAWEKQGVLCEPIDVEKEKILETSTETKLEILKPEIFSERLVSFFSKTNNDMAQRFDLIEKKMDLINEKLFKLDKLLTPYFKDIENLALLKVEDKRQFSKPLLEKKEIKQPEDIFVFPEPDVTPVFISGISGEPTTTHAQTQKQVNIRGLGKHEMLFLKKSGLIR